MLLMLAQVVILASGFGISIILGRGLGPVEFGVYGTALAVLTVFERILAAGIPIAAATLIARQHSRQAELEQAAFVLMCAWAMLLWAALEAGAPMISQLLHVDALLLRVLAFNIPAMGLYLAYDAIFSGRREFAVQSSLQTVQSLAKLAAICVLLFLGLTVVRVFAVHVAATFVAAGIAMLRFPPTWQWPRRDVVISMLRIAFTSGFYTIALSLLMSLGLWQLGASSAQTGAGIGFYVAGQNVTRLLMVIPISLSGVLFTSASWAAGRSDREQFTQYVTATMRLALILLLPACVLVWIDAEGIIGLLYGSRYAGAGEVLAMLCIAYSLLGVFDILAHVLMAEGRFRLAAGLACALALIQYLMNRQLIPVAGAVGAAASMAIAFLAGILIIAIDILRRRGAILRWGSTLRVAGICALIGLISTQVPAASAWLVGKLTVLGVTYLAALWVLREVTPADLQAFKKRKPDPT